MRWSNPQSDFPWPGHCGGAGHFFAWYKERFDLAADWFLFLRATVVQSAVEAATLMVTLQLVEINMFSFEIVSALHKFIRICVYLFSKRRHSFKEVIII
ncbi:hypothetical protein [Silvimonas terrae]|nr:hypothetical protein [Silvimonas terrae]